MSAVYLDSVAAAIAASKCWLHRNSPLRLTEIGTQPDHQGGGKPRTQRMTHPSECDWCAYPSNVLIASVEQFMLLNTDLVERFEMKPQAEQRRAVLAAQGFGQEDRAPRRGAVEKQKAPATGAGADDGDLAEVSFL